MVGIFRVTAEAGRAVLLAIGDAPCTVCMSVLLGENAAVCRDAVIDPLALKDGGEGILRRCVR